MYWNIVNSDTTGERKQKKHRGLTATAGLKRQTEGGGMVCAGDTALHESLFINVLLDSRTLNKYLCG